MFKKSSILFLFLGFICTAPLAFSQENERVELIKEIIEANHAMDQIRAGRDLMPGQIEQQLKLTGVTLSPEQLEILKEVALEEYIALEDDMLAIIVRLYDSKFTVPELKELNRFYRSETGQKLSDLMPEFMAETMAETNRLVIEMMPRFQQKLQERFKQLEQDTTS